MVKIVFLVKYPHRSIPDHLAEGEAEAEGEGEAEAEAEGEAEADGK